MRYSTEMDQERLACGWGHHAWILDAGKKIRLLPEVEAGNECDRLNLQIARDQEFGLIGRVLNKTTELLERVRR